MIDEKKQIIDNINFSQKNIDCKDSFYTLYLKSKLARSKENIKKGNTITLQELEEFIGRLEERH